MKKVIAFFALFIWSIAAQKVPISFEGVKSIDERALYEVLGTPKPLFFEFWKQPPCLDPDRVPAMLPLIENYYKTHGFYHATANADITPERIVIKVQENEPIRVKVISTVSPLPIKALIPFHTGERFDAEKFVKSKKAILHHYRNNHYCNARLDAKAFLDIEKNEAYLVYDVHPKRPCVFGKITITSPESVDPRIVESLLMFREGDPYSLELIRLSYREIYANEGVERVTIDDSHREENRVPVHVDVTTYPKPLHFTAGAGYSSDEGINLQAALKHRNFFGNLKTFGVEARYSQIKEYAGFSAEMPLAHHNRAGLYTRFKREKFDGYDEESITATLSLKHTYHPHSLQESLVFDRIQTKNSTDEATFPNGLLRIVSPKIGWEVDRRDSFLDPTKGYRLEIQGMGSLKSYLSEATYYKIFGMASHHRKLSAGILSAQLKFGSIDVMDGRIPPSYRFYAGGMNSNRAWHYRQLGPKNRYGDPIGAYSLMEATVEMRMPLEKNFRWVLFADATWLGQDPYPALDKAYLAVGPGIRYLTPMGPIALDLGVDPENIRRFALHFHIGELF